MTSIRDMTDDALVEIPPRTSLIKPFIISHGTLECRSLARSRRFYEEVLGLECVVHSPTSMGVRCGMKFHIIAVEVGEAFHPAALLNHWGLDVATRDEVDQAYRDVIAVKDRYGLLQAKEPQDRHGIYGFYFQDFDTNWWEIQYYPGFLNDDMFDFGDRYSLIDRDEFEVAMTASGSA